MKTPSNIPDLLPCPCCGSEAKFGEVIDGPDKGGEFIECVRGTCMLTTRLIFPLGEDVKQQLADTWNQRVGARPDGASQSEPGSGSSAAPSSALFGYLPLDGRVDALRRSWIGAARALRQMGARDDVARRLEMCVEEIAMIQAQNEKAER